MSNTGSLPLFLGGWGRGGKKHQPTALPAGVTLRPIDGGPNYYANNGFTYAADAGFNGMSWDDPRFFPIGQDYCFYSSNSTATFLDLGLNYSHRVTSDTNLSVLRNAGIWAIPQNGEYTGTPGAETVGWHIEEPPDLADIESTFASIGSNHTGRFVQMSTTWNQLWYGDIGGVPMDEVYATLWDTSVGPRHLNIPGDDEYWFAAAPTGFGQFVGGTMYNGGTDLTTDQMARGDHYGDMIDTMREWLVTYPAPVISAYIESSDGLLGEINRARITPPQLNWAVWQTLVHGARGVLYFSTTSNFGDGATFDFSDTIQSGQSISMYDHAKAMHTLIRNVAPILNSPFALGYATVTPAGYVFPTGILSLTNGVDIMTKYYTGQPYSNAAGSFAPGFYVFASVRGSQTQTNVSATFTTAGRYTGPVAVVNEARTVTATNGVFTDTFALATDVHIYQVP